MRISVFGFLGDGGGRSPVDRYVEHLRRVRDEGFTRLWTAQLPHEPDVLTTMAVAVREVDGIEVAAGVLPIHVQHPMALAQRALTVNLISGGRLVLGLGLSHKVVAENTWGISWDRPVRRMSEFLDGLLPLLAGAPANATGEFTTTRGALRIPGAPTPPVYLAALGPQMLRLAGRRTAGTVTWMTGPRTVSEHVRPSLDEAAGGREVEVVTALPICVTDDADAARAGSQRLRDLREAALVPRNARPRGLGRAGGRCAHRHRGRGRRADRGAARGGCRRVRRGHIRLERTARPHPSPAAELQVIADSVHSARYGRR